MSDIEILDDLPKALNKALTDFVMHVANTLSPIGGKVDYHGIKTEFEVAEDEFVRMTPFCWCDGEDCPWCTHEIEDVESPEVREQFKAAGFVEDQGAPNLWLRIGGTDVRIWWYKYPGRSMKVSGIETLKELTVLRTAYDGWRLEHELPIYIKSIDNEVAFATDNMAPELAETIRLGFTAQMLVAADRSACAAQLTEAIFALHHANSACAEVARVKKILDEAEVPKHTEDEDTPEELTLKLAPHARIEWLFQHVDVAAGVEAMKANLHDECPDDPDNDEQVGDDTESVPF